MGIEWRIVIEGHGPSLPTVNVEGGTVTSYSGIIVNDRTRDEDTLAPVSDFTAAARTPSQSLPAPLKLA